MNLVGSELSRLIIYYFFSTLKMTRDVPAFETVGQELAGMDKVDTFQISNLSKNGL